MKLSEFLEISPDNHEIANAFAKTQQYLAKCERAQCSISGGADSDVMLDIVTKADEENKVTYVFFNTGIEYEATKKHLKYLQEKYGIEIKEYKAKAPVPLACRKHGQPFLSKYISEVISRLQRHGFKWENEPFEELYKKYPKCKSALRWWCNEHGERSKFNINYSPYLKEFMIENPPDFIISNKCCNYAKKHVAKEALKEEACDLAMVGVRKAEGGVRGAAYKSCFSDATAKNVANFRPLFWFTNADKREYENIFDVTHSECYTKYGLDRTGCAGCPFGKDFEKELEIIKEFEPKLYTAVNNIFGKSYEYTRKYYAYRKEAKEREKGV